MDKKNIVFDFGGVLFRWHPANFLSRVWPHRVSDEASVRELVLQFFENYGGDWGHFDQGLIDAPTVVSRISVRTGWPLSEVQSVMDGITEELRVQHDTVALIEELKSAGHRLFFLSNMPEPIADHLEQNYPLHQWFEGGVFSGRVKHIKPNREIFEIAVERFKVAPESCVFLDDHPVNIEAAKALGWNAILFTDAASARQQLQALVR